MTRDELLQLHKDLCQKGYDLMVKKNHDYAGDRGIFANFETCEKLGVCSTLEGMLTRKLDKISRLITLVKNGELKVQDERVEDTLIDDINYDILLAAYLRAKAEK